MKICALDIGGTSIKSGLWENGQLSELREQETNAHRGGAYVMEKTVEIIRTYGKVDAIGISTTGQVDTVQGSIYYANDNVPGYTGMKVKDRLEEIFQVPVAVENDVNAAALGEAYYGVGKGKKTFLTVTYGTGVGGAIIINGEVLRGMSYSAGSFGGMIIHPEQVSGNPYDGTYERCASTTALIAKAKMLDPTLDTGRRIFEAKEQSEVKEIIDAWIDEIVIGLVTLVHVFNPEGIALGGGIMAQPYVSKEVEKRVRNLLLPGFEGVEIRPCALGNTAGMLGAVSLLYE